MEKISWIGRVKYEVRITQGQGRQECPICNKQKEG